MPKKATEKSKKIKEVKPKVSRKKNINKHCLYCEKITKMEVVGEMENVDGKIWYKCTRCRHMNLLEKIDTQSEQEINFDTENIIDYKPSQEYKIGQIIFHEALNDTGKIISKTKVSNGNNAIVVIFKNNGQKTLIENLKIEEENGEGV